MSQISGNVLPISYQYELSEAFKQLLNTDDSLYKSWLLANDIDVDSNDQSPIYSLSNLYVPKVFVNNDRLTINVPRIQFWVSFLQENETREFLFKQLLGREFSIGDDKSSVSFKVIGIDDISPVRFNDYMEYQSISPIVIKALRSNNTLEFLNPSNAYFAQFLYDGIVERWEHYYGCRFYGVRGYQFALLSPEKRKAVNLFASTENPQKEVGYMLKFSLLMDPMLHEFAYIAGVGDDTQYGFGYLELLKKKK